MVLPLLAGGLMLTSGCVVEGPPPAVGVEASADVDVAVVPDNYVWDGYENVGFVGDQPYYLGPGNVWVVCDPVRVERFNGWVNVHPDWRDHVTVNVNYRNDARGRYSAPRNLEARDQKLDEQQQRIDALHQKRDEQAEQQEGHATAAYRCPPSEARCTGCAAKGQTTATYRRAPSKAR